MWVFQGQLPEARDEVDASNLDLGGSTHGVDRGGGSVFIYFFADLNPIGRFWCLNAVVQLADGGD